jgi:hypothetical protein
MSVWNSKHHSSTSNCLCGAKRYMNDSASRVHRHWPTHVCYRRINHTRILLPCLNTVDINGNLFTVDYLHSLWLFVLPSKCLFVYLVLLIAHSLICTFILFFWPFIILIYICMLPSRPHPFIASSFIPCVYVVYRMRLPLVTQSLMCPKNGENIYCIWIFEWEFNKFYCGILNLRQSEIEICTLSTLVGEWRKLF